MTHMSQVQAEESTPSSPKTLQELQVDLFEWQTKNFGIQDKELTLLGICEETGELCHSALKMEQNIRGSRAQHEAAMKDSIGDIMIYALNYLSACGAVVPSFKTEKIPPGEDRVVRRAVLATYRLAARIIEKPEESSRVGQLLYQVGYVASLKQWDLEEIFREVWSQVSQRDWVKYPETGRPPVADSTETI